MLELMTLLTLQLILLINLAVASHCFLFVHQSQVITTFIDVPFNRQPLSFDDCVEGETEDYQKCSVLY